MNEKIKVTAPELNLILPQKRAKLKNGDLLRGENWVSKVGLPFKPNWNKYQYLTLVGISQDPWKALEKLQIGNYDKLKEAVSYKDKWSSNIYYAFIPCYIESTNIDKYKERWPDPIGYWNEYFFDVEWMSSKLDSLELWPVAESLFGHGYIEYDGADGEAGSEIAAVNLSNGDRLLGWLWVWHNK